MSYIAIGATLREMHEAGDVHTDEVRAADTTIDYGMRAKWIAGV
jgi:hypothetical protein